jgi:zinc D-Ala-D-Ala carboxypeptidase
MPTAMLSEHFSYAEMIYSQTASRMGLSNEPDSVSYENLKKLCEVLEQVRMLCGSNPVTITSGYRSPEVNKACGGSTTSAHMSGLAADFIIPGYGDPLSICQMLEQYLAALNVDQLIWEYSDWVHLAIALPPATARCECLTIDNNGTRYGFA